MEGPLIITRIGKRKSDAEVAMKKGRTNETRIRSPVRDGKRVDGREKKLAKQFLNDVNATLQVYSYESLLDSRGLPQSGKCSCGSLFEPSYPGIHLLSVATNHERN